MAVGPNSEVKDCRETGNWQVRVLGVTGNVIQHHDPKPRENNLIKVRTCLTQSTEGLKRLLEIQISQPSLQLTHTAEK